MVCLLRLAVDTPRIRFFWISFSAPAPKSELAEEYNCVVYHGMAFGELYGQHRASIGLIMT